MTKIGHKLSSESKPKDDSGLSGCHVHTPTEAFILRRSKNEFKPKICHAQGHRDASPKNHPRIRLISGRSGTSHKCPSAIGVCVHSGPQGNAMLVLEFRIPPFPLLLLRDKTGIPIRRSRSPHANSRHDIALVLVYVTSTRPLH
jgi:hypothetical protein